MYEPRGLVSTIPEIDRLEFFALLIQREELKVGSGMVEPCHPLRCGAPHTRGNDHLETTEMPTRITLFAAVIEPENAERENAVDCTGGFSLTNAYNSIGSRAPKQPPTYVCRTKAVLEVHGRSESIDLRPDECARENAFQQTLIAAASRVASRGSTTIACGHQFERLWFGCS